MMNSPLDNTTPVKEYNAWGRCIYQVIFFTLLPGSFYSLRLLREFRKISAAVSVRKYGVNSKHCTSSEENSLD